VRKAYALSILAMRRRFEADASVPGATPQTLNLLLQALRLLPPGRWIPAAAVIAIWRVLAEACPDACGDAWTAEAALELLAGYSITMRETKSVYKENGVLLRTLLTARCCRTLSMPLLDLPLNLTLSSCLHACFIL
jgi:hypothetical protein